MCTERATSWIIDLYWFYEKERKKKKKESLDTSELLLLKGIKNMKGCFLINAVSTE